MALSVVTVYDEQEKQYLDLIDKSKDVNEVVEIKSKLNKLSAIKYDTMTLTDMASEIDARFAAQDQGIYTSDYTAWKEQLATLNDEETTEYARNLLITSDKINYGTISKKRIATIQELSESIAGSNYVTTVGGTGEATLSGGTVYTITTDENGVSTLTSTENSVTIPEGGVIGGKIDVSKLEQDPLLLDRRPAWIDTNIEYHRQKTADGIAIDSAIVKRYYSILDAELYFGNEYVEDVHDCNWRISQNVQPLFGYNSYTYDELARGNRLISGNFTIVFTSPNYLFSILSAANKANVTLIENMASYDVPKLSDTIEPIQRTAAYGQRESGHHAAMWPQDFDIDIIFGEKTGAGDPVHIIILGCAITGCQQVLSASGSGAPPAIMEQYSFIAQDIRTSVLSTKSTATSSSKTQPTSTTANISSDTSDVTDEPVSNAEAAALGKSIEKVQAERDAEAKKKAKEKKVEKEANEQKAKVQAASDGVKAYMKKITDDYDGKQSLNTTDNAYFKGANMVVHTIMNNTNTEPIAYQLDLNYPNMSSVQAQAAAILKIKDLQKLTYADKYSGWDAIDNTDDGGVANNGKSYRYVIVKKGETVSPSQIVPLASI